MVAVVKVQTTGTGDAIARLEGLAARARDLSPALRDVARDVEKRTDDAFRRSVSPEGEAWPDLAESTKAQRLARRKETRGGGKGKKGKAKVAALLSGLGNPGALRPLVDTGRMRNSSHAEVSGPTSVRWSAVGYMGPHMAGGKNGRPPKRNPAVFELAGGHWRVIASVQRYMVDRIKRHVGGG